MPKGFVGLGDGLEPMQAAVVSLQARMENYERSLLRDALRQTYGNVAEAAKRLNVPKKTLYDKLARHQLDPETFRRQGS